VEDHELEQWIISLPLDRLPEVTKALEELPTSSDESKLESAIRDSIALTWKNLSKEQLDNAVVKYPFYIPMISRQNHVC